MRWLRPPNLAVAVGIVALSLLAAGCGGGSGPGVASTASSTAPGASGSTRTAGSRSHTLLVAGRCLRRHGIPDLPDPTVATAGPAKGHAVLDKGALVRVPSSVVQRALHACRTALERADVYQGSSSAARTPQEIQDGLAFARCVRHHGITNFPDPNGRGQFDLSGTGIDPHRLTPSQLAAARACLPAAHGAVHLPTQGTGAGSTGH